MTRRAAERAGRRAETVAAFYLRCLGFRVLDRRFRAAAGEIDIVAARGGTLLFVEVKRRAVQGDALIAVTHGAEQRIARAGAIWLARSGRDWAAVRYDLIAIGRWRLAHVRDAFRPGSGGGGAEGLF